MKRMGLCYGDQSYGYRNPLLTPMLYRLRRKRLERHLPGDHLVPKCRLAGFGVILASDFAPDEVDGDAFNHLF